jgi:MFS family permease
MLLGQFRLGFIIFGIVTFIGTLLAVLIVHEPSNIGVEITSENSPEKKQTEKKTLHEILSIFPGWKIGRDYYLALMGKLFQGVSNFAITGYLLYILTDYIGKSTGSTQTSIQLINTIMLIFGILMGFVAGPFADKFKVLKWPIGSSTIFLALGALSMFLLHNDIGIVIYAFMAGIGMGIWNSLDNLLNLEVIPDPNRVAFFLGVYNLGNTITQALAPVIAAIVISTFGYSAIFILSFVFAVIGGVLIFSIKSVKR